jgi:hypothetical protein
LDIFKDHDGHIARWIHNQTADFHFHIHGQLRSRLR